MENIEGNERERKQVMKKDTVEGREERLTVGRLGWRNNELYYKPKLNLLVESIAKKVIYLMFDKCPPSKVENKEAFLSSNFAIL